MKNPAPITYLALDSVGEFRLMFVSWASGGYRFYRPGPSLVRCCYTWNNPGPPRRWWWATADNHPQTAGRLTDLPTDLLNKFCWPKCTHEYFAPLPRVSSISPGYACRSRGGAAAASISRTVPLSFRPPNSLCHLLPSSALRDFIRRKRTCELCGPRRWKPLLQKAPPPWPSCCSKSYSK